MSLDYRKPMHKLETAHFGAQAVIFACVLSLAGAAVGCGDDDTSGSSGSGGSGAGGAGGSCSASSGGPIAAPKPDMHCIGDDGKAIKQEVNESACPAPPGAPPEEEGDAGASDFGPTLNGSEGDDDDCKYHLKWTTTCITQGSDFTVTVTITDKVDGKPVVVTPAKIDGELDYELYLDDHLAPNTKPKYKTTSKPGVYTLGPLRVDQSGKWTLRFHIRPDCVDLTEDSPHGHAAFFINVP